MGINMPNFNSPTFRLFAMPSFAEGIGSLFDFFGDSHIYNRNTTPEEADYLALRSDVKAICQDLRNAYEEEIAKDQ